MTSIITFALDKIKGNFRKWGEERQVWREQESEHLGRIQNAKNWFRGPDDADGKLHALKNYWVEFVRANPRRTAEGLLFYVLAQLILLIIFLVLR